MRIKSCEVTVAWGSWEGGNAWNRTIQISNEKSGLGHGICSCHRLSDEIS